MSMSLLQDLAGHQIGRPADEAVDDELLAVRGGDGAAGRPEIDPDAQHATLFFSCHWIVSFLICSANACYP